MCQFLYLLQQWFSTSLWFAAPFLGYRISLRLCGICGTHCHKLLVKSPISSVIGSTHRAFLGYAGKEPLYCMEITLVSQFIIWRKKKQHFKFLSVFQKVNEIYSMPFFNSSSGNFIFSGKCFFEMLKNIRRSPVVSALNIEAREYLK